MSENNIIDDTILMKDTRPLELIQSIVYEIKLNKKPVVLSTSDSDDDDDDNIIIDDESDYASEYDDDDRSNSMSEYFVTNWKLFPYDVSKLLGDYNDINLEDVKKKYKKVLLKNRISKKNFCKIVLNTTIKVIRRLFAPKRNFGSLKDEYKIIILKIYLWVNDSESVRKVRDLVLPGLLFNLSLKKKKKNFFFKWVLHP
jgi:hypothetical protein